MNKIDNLLEKIRTNPSSWKLWKKADPQTIQTYKAAFGVILPEDYKSFLTHSNGLDSVFRAEDAKGLWQKGEYEETNSQVNKILSIEEVFEEYETLSLDKWKIDREMTDFYPYIPFCVSGEGEKLVFLNQKLKKEPAIFYAWHDEPASAWIAVAKNFTEFLSFFIESKGQLPTDEVGKNLSIEDFLETFDFGAMKEKLDEPKEVIKRTSAYLELFPKDSLSYTLRANAYADSLQFEKALADFNKSLEMNPKSAFAHICRGNMFLEIKKPRQALTDFDSACNLEPDDPYYLSLRGEAFYQLNRMENALADCTRAIEIDDTYEMAYRTRFYIYLFYGYDDLAKADSDRINELLANN